MLSKRWRVAPPLSADAALALKDYPPVIRQVLYNRGITTAAQAASFLNADPPPETSPWRIKGMRSCVERLLQAIDARESIAIYGDYDVDGVTATALLVQTLQALGAQVSGYIPNRFDEGYGLNNDALDYLAASGVRVVVTVDCGIRSPAEAAHARNLGLDLIITDHHHPAEGSLPPALAILNPKQPGDDYPDKNLAGVGLAYKLAEALLEKRPAPALNPDDLLDLVALGTVADLAPLSGENRALVRRGLKRIHLTRRQGLHSLARVSEIPIGKVTTTHIGFGFGPRLNAAGRLDSALAAFELLISPDPNRTGLLAQQLDAQNRERQALTRSTQEQAEKLALSADPDGLLLFAVDDSFNPGVVGLAASRLCETHYRPAIVAARDAETTRGSCRSIPEFHITDALDACADLLVRHGGHAAAAGFTVRNENLAELTRRLKAIAAQRLAGLDLRPQLTADVEVPLSAMTPDLLPYLDALQPTGLGNPEALFLSRNVRVGSSRIVGTDGQHLKLTLNDGRVTYDAIGFRLGPLGPTLTDRVDVIYTFEVNEFNGRTSLQLNLRDVRPAGRGD